MIKSAISSTVYTRLVTTTSIVAKLAVCAVLLAGINSARAADPAPRKAAPSDKVDQLKLAKLEREWKRLHSERQAGMLNRLVACGELGHCEGLKIHPAPAARIYSAAVDADIGDINAASPPYDGALPINP